MSDLCRRFEEALQQAMIDGCSLSDPVLLRHESSCEGCALARKESQELLLSLSGLPYPPPPRELGEQVMREVRALSSSATPSLLERLQGLFEFSGGWLPVGVAAVAILGLVFWPSGSPRLPDPATRLAHVDSGSLPLPSEAPVAASDPSNVIVSLPSGRLATGETWINSSREGVALAVGARTRAQVLPDASIRLADRGLMVLSGVVSFDVEAGSEPVEVGCPAGRVVVLGTRFTLEVAASGSTTLTVERGRVRFEGTEGRSLEVTADDGPAIASPGGAPRWSPTPGSAARGQEPRDPDAGNRVPISLDPSLEDPFGDP